MHNVGLDPSSPLNRVLQRQPVGPWKRVGYVTTDDPAMSQSRDRSMVFYAQTVDTRRDKYNYQVVDSNNVPMDIAEKVGWKSDGEMLSVPGQTASYTLHLYANYK